MILGIWGGDKTGKNTLAFSAPKPLHDMEFDIGGFERACRNLPNLPIADWVKQGLITRSMYAVPIKIGQFDPNSPNSVRPSKIITGMKELFYQWLNDYLNALKNPSIKTIMLDTGTILYNLVCQGYLQEKQEIQLPSINPLTGMDRNGNPLRSSLSQMEYREPNDRFRGIIYNAKVYEKNLIITHHERPEYKLMPQKDGSLAKSPTGRMERAGFATLGDSADFVIHTYVKEEPILGSSGEKVYNGGKLVTTRVPYGCVDLASVQELFGMEMAEPTFDKLDRMAKMIRGEV